MTIDKALSVLGIKRNYTEEQLKKRYRELVKENHPDYHMNAPEEEQIEYNHKLQEINEAYNLLTKSLHQNNTDTQKSSPYSSNQSQREYTTRKYDEKTVLKQLETIKKIKSYHKECEAKKLMELVWNLIIKYTIIIARTSEDFDTVFNNFKQELEKIYRKYILLYCKKHQIPSFIMEMKQKDFKFDCDCARLFLQLQGCEIAISFDASKIIRKYQEHKHFEKLQAQILLEKDKFRQKLNFDTSKSKYLELLDEYESTIDRLVSKYDETSKKASSEPIISKSKEKIFLGLRKRYLANCNDKDVELINKLFLTAAELLYRENCSLKLTNEIDKITFEHPKKEYDRLIKLSTNKVKTFDEFLCVKKDFNESEYNIHKAIIVSSDGINYYKVKNIGKSDEVIDEKNFEENYINIDDVLSDAIFLGYKQENYPFNEILYHNPNNGMTIMRYPELMVYEIVKEIPYDSSFKRNKKTDIYQNKVSLKEELSKSFDKLYKIINKKNKNKGK